MAKRKRDNDEMEIGEKEELQCEMKSLCDTNIKNASDCDRNIRDLQTMFGNDQEKIYTKEIDEAIQVVDQYGSYIRDNSVSVDLYPLSFQNAMENALRITKVDTNFKNTVSEPVSVSVSLSSTVPATATTTATATTGILKTLHTDKRFQTTVDIIKNFAKKIIKDSKTNADINIPIMEHEYYLSYLREYSPKLHRFPCLLAFDDPDNKYNHVKKEITKKVDNKINCCYANLYHGITLPSFYNSLEDRDDPNASATFCIFCIREIVREFDVLNTANGYLGYGRIINPHQNVVGSPTLYAEKAKNGTNKCCLEYKQEYMFNPLHKNSGIYGNFLKHDHTFYQVRSDANGRYLEEKDFLFFRH